MEIIIIHNFEFVVPAKVSGFGAYRLIIYININPNKILVNADDRKENIHL